MLGLIVASVFENPMANEKILLLLLLLLLLLRGALCVGVGRRAVERQGMANFYTHEDIGSLTIF